MKKAFTLIELLVVISIIALLMGVLMPSLSKAKSVARDVVCKNNIRQLGLSNISYATENDNFFVLAAEDINSGNLHRWHGVRENNNVPFDASQSSLADYLGNGEVKKCPERVKFRQGQPWDSNFEDGCGGYGYNMTYLGSKMWQDGFSGCNRATRQTQVRNNTETVMFADTAMTRLDGQVAYYLEYSFVEPPFFLKDGNPNPAWGYASPSIHFRHSGNANIAWADGHVEKREMTDFSGVNVYGVKSADMRIGWFFPLNNSLFDLQ